MPDQRLLILGIDGAAWDTLSIMMARGLMPALKELLGAGVRGTLMSTLPPYTPIAWSTFATGMNPGRHGVFDFASFSPEHGYRFVDSASIQAPTLWNILNHHGRKAAVIHFPISYPVEQVDGLMVSGFLTPPRVRHICHPADLLRTIGCSEDYTLNVPVPAFSAYSAVEAGRFTADLLKMTETRARVMEYALARDDIDCTFVLFMMIDQLSHALHGFMIDPERDPAVFILIAACFRRIDGLVAAARAWSDAAPGRTLMLMSDHGFTPYKRTFNVNVLLQKLGYVRTGRLRMIMAAAAERLGRFLPTQRGGLRLRQQGVVPADAACFMPPNVRDRLRVNPAVFDTREKIAGLRDRIMEAVRAAETEGGQPLVKAIHLADEIYHGSLVSTTEALIIEPHDGVYPVPAISLKQSDAVSFPISTPQGMHQREGIFAAYGAAVQTPGTAVDLDMTDMLPNALAVLGVPVSRGFDGKVTPGLWKTEPEFTDGYEGLTRVAGRARFSTGEARAVRKQLEDIGYL